MTNPRDFAVQAHGSQMYGAQPYAAHLDAVAARAAAYRPGLCDGIWGEIDTILAPALTPAP